MFSGIIEELGTVAAFEPLKVGARLMISCKTVLEDASIGSSIAVNGVCLTVVSLQADCFGADLALETLNRTNLSDLQAGCPVNLERPVTPATRLSGHIVQGHVDSTGDVVSLEPLGEGNWWLRVGVPASLQQYLVVKGSIALDGISLTIASLDDGLVTATIIPHTFSHTTLGYKRAGSRINVEVDVLAKHIERLMRWGPQLVG